MPGSDEDYHNFSTPSSHRLPTISGTQAVRNAVLNSRPVSSGLASLDAILSSTSATQGPARGFRRGVVTEVFGPPGVGKTTLALQAAVNAIKHDNARVTWISTSSPLMLSRLQQMLSGGGVGGVGGVDDDADGVLADPSAPQHDQIASLLERLDYFEVTSLPKFLALFLHPPNGFPQAGTTLVVIDDLSNLLLSSLPRKVRQSGPPMSQTTPTRIRTDYANKQAILRRTQVIASLASSLQTFAAAKNVAMLLTSKASISLKVGRQAILRPAISSQQWDACLGTRIALYRDFWPPQAASMTDQETDDKVPTDFERWSLRYAQVVMLSGRDLLTNEVGFVIEESGLREVISASMPRQLPFLPATFQVDPGSDDFLAEEDAHHDDSLEHTHHDIPSELDIEGSADFLSQLTKRKAAEIADSDDEGAGPPETAVRKDPDVISDLEHVVQSDSGAPNSQLVPTFQTAKKLRFDESNKKSSTNATTTADARLMANGDDDQMLLDEIESSDAVPAFSQAAAEMSDPLTPSDDGRQSP